MIPNIRLHDGFSVVIWPDLHAPRHHKPSVDACLKYIRFLKKKHNKPDAFISLGDWCDFDSLSRFNIIKDEDMIGLVDEIKSANQVLDAVDSALPKNCKKYMIMGNHDKRPEIYRLNNWDSKDQKLFGRYFETDRIPNAETLYGLEKRGWDWVPYGDIIKIGKAIYTHGWFVNKWHSEKTLLKWFQTVIYGHAHNFQVCNRNGMDGNPVAAICIGTLSRFDLSYLNGVPPDWVNMFATVDYFKDGTFTPNMTPIINGRFIRDGVVFSGGST